MLLEVKGLKAGYGKKTVIEDLSLHVNEGEIVAIFGHNGAGKTTTLKSIFGLVKPWQGEILYGGNNVTALSPMDKVKQRLVFIPQERVVFGTLNVRDNLELGGYAVNDRAAAAASLESVNKLFPILKQRQLQLAGTLSGGEQRMVSLGMGMMSKPRLLMLDEPSIGLSPVVVGNVMNAVLEIRRAFGAAVILVEQNVKQALRIADRIYVMKMGRIILEEDRASFARRGHWTDLF